MNANNAYNLHKLTQDIATTLENSGKAGDTNITGAEIIDALEDTKLITKTEATKIRKARSTDGY